MTDSLKITNCHEVVAIIGTSHNCLVNGDYTFVTQTESLIEEAEANGSSVIRDFSATAALLAVMAAKKPVFDVMDDSTWLKMGSPLKAIENSLSEMIGEEHVKNAVFPTTPPDLPVELASQRLDHVLRFPNVRDIPTLEELSEILMAHWNSREVEEDRFRPESLSRITWSESVSNESGCRTLYATLSRHLNEGEHSISDANRSLLQIGLAEMSHAIKLANEERVTNEHSPKP